jgi:hypothetical protein
MLYERQFIVAPEAGSRTFRMTCPRSKGDRINQNAAHKILYFTAVLQIRIGMFLSPPDPDPLIRGTDPDPTPNPSTISNSKKNLDSYCFMTSL